MNCIDELLAEDRLFSQSELERAGLKLQDHNFASYVWFSSVTDLYTFTVDNPVINTIILYDFEHKYNLGGE